MTKLELKTASGLSKIQGNLMSKKDVVIRGNSTIDGNIKAENVFIGKPIDMRPIIKPYKVHGNIVADNEVNIKILLSQLVKAGRLSNDQRNSLLVEMTDDIASNNRMGFNDFVFMVRETSGF